MDCLLWLWAPSRKRTSWGRSHSGCTTLCFWPTVGKCLAAHSSHQYLVVLSPTPLAWISFFSYRHKAQGPCVVVRRARTLESLSKPPLPEHGLCAREVVKGIIFPLYFPAHWDLETVRNLLKIKELVKGRVGIGTQFHLSLKPLLFFFTRMTLCLPETRRTDFCSQLATS